MNIIKIIYKEVLNRNICDVGGKAQLFSPCNGGAK